MTTEDTPDPRARPALALGEGPLADALCAIDRALVDIETAKAALTSRRHDFARVLRAEVAARAGDDPALPDELCGVIRALYWDHATLRLSDLSAATGLDNERIRRIAGPRLVDVGCVTCGTPTEVLQTRRSERVTGRCPDCRQHACDPWEAPDPWSSPSGPPGPTVVPPPDGDWLDLLLVHLETRLRTVDCDHQLTLTRRWAMREGVAQEAVVAGVRAFGGFCDCEVVMNAPPSAGPGRARR